MIAFLKFAIPALFSRVFWLSAYYGYKFCETGEKKWQIKLQNLAEGER